MIKPVKLVKNIFYKPANRAVTQITKPVTSIGEHLSGNLKVTNESNLLSTSREDGIFFQNIWNNFKQFLKIFKPKAKPPQYYSPEISEKAVNGTLKKYLESYTPPKGMSIEQFEAKIKNKLSRFYLNEAKQIEKIITKNKSVFEKLDSQYQASLDEIFSKMKSMKIPKEDASKYYFTEKAKADQAFGDKILDIFSKEYNMEGIRPVLKCYEKMSGKTVGGWNAILGLIAVNSNAFKNLEKFAGILYHEYTHFMQDVELFKNVGKLEYIKCYGVPSAIELYKEKKTIAKFVVHEIYKEIMRNPMYRELEIYLKKHSQKTKGIQKQLLKIRIAEICHYKNCDNSSYEEYLNQLLELHAHHNENYFRELYRQIFPNCTTNIKCTK